MSTETKEVTPERESPLLPGGGRLDLALLPEARALDGAVDAGPLAARPGDRRRGRPRGRRHHALLQPLVRLDAPPGGGVRLDPRRAEGLGDRLDRAALGLRRGVPVPRRAPAEVRDLGRDHRLRRHPLAAQPQLPPVAVSGGGDRAGAGRTGDRHRIARGARCGPRRRQSHQPAADHAALRRLGRGPREPLRRHGEGIMTNAYTSPFGERYSSKEMLGIFSPDKKFRTWRQLWIALARAEKKLGIKRITDAMIAEMEKHADDINYASARAFEEKFKHDVMGHIHAYEELCPTAKGIIHLGATSMYVVDNTDLILMRDAMDLLERQLVNVISALAKFAKKHASTPTVAFTHFQPAQFTTVGKRACLWLADLLIDLDEIALRRKSLQFLGVKGTTGTQASFLELFDGDEDKVRKLDVAVTRAMGFSSAVPV